MISFGYVGLALLTIQQTSMPLMVRFARMRSKEDRFLASSSVVIGELIKLIFCSTILIIKEQSVGRFLTFCNDFIVKQPFETLKIFVPATLYMMQNNLYYIALTHLESTTFCVTYQLKIFSTAILMVTMLKRKISQTQWLSIAILAIGVTLVQLQQQTSKNLVMKNEDQNPILGLCAVLIMIFTSGFAGVYLEKVLKGSTVNIWMQNIRLSLIGLPISLISMYCQDYDEIAKDGILQDWDWLVWLLTLNNSVGGLLISIVIKYADNILKTFAQSMAIIGSAFGSIIFFHFAPNIIFTIGGSLVLISSCLYAKYPPNLDECAEKPMKIRMHTSVRLP